MNKYVDPKQLDALIKGQMVIYTRESENKRDKIFFVLGRLEDGRLQGLRLGDNTFTFIDPNHVEEIVFPGLFTQVFKNKPIVKGQHISIETLKVAPYKDIQLAIRDVENYLNDDLPF